MAIVTLTIDGEQVSGNEDESILDIASQYDIHIPTLCHLDGLTDVGACRLCMVEIEGLAELMPACTWRA
jgi:bidirectional [NiFe] hydrogenase diaphorase subunit